MTAIRLHPDNRRIEEPAEMASFLEGEGLIYRNWDVSKLRDGLRDNYALTEAEKAEILAAFKEEVESLKTEGGYVAADVVVLSERTPDLATLLDKFSREHHHSEDEVRFVIDGHGIFTIFGRSGRYFDVMVGPGDLITVPGGARHWFTLTEDRRMKCIRLFQDPSGWAAFYEDHPPTAFISYDFQNPAVALRLRHNLELLGLEVTDGKLDASASKSADLQDFVNRINHRITQADCFCGVLTAKYETNDGRILASEWIIAEYALAVAQKKHTILCIEKGVSAPPMLEKTRDWIEFVGNFPGELLIKIHAMIKPTLAVPLKQRFPPFHPFDILQEKALHLKRKVLPVKYLGVGLSDALYHDNDYSRYLKATIEASRRFEALFLHPESPLLEIRSTHQNKSLTTVRKEILDTTEILLNLGSALGQNSVSVSFYRQPPLWRMYFVRGDKGNCVFVRPYNRFMEDRDPQQTGCFIVEQERDPKAWHVAERVWDEYQRNSEKIDMRALRVLRRRLINVTKV